MEYKNKAKNGLFNTILSAICVFVGVGFVTGAEIWFYFSRFGAGQVFGLLIFVCLTFVLVMFSFSNRKEENLKIEKIKNRIEGVSEMLVASAMVSGLLETSRTLFGKWWFWFFLGAVLVVGCLLFSGQKSFVIYNYFVAIFVIFVVIILFLINNNFSYKKLLNFGANFDIKNGLLSSLFACVYTFMNISEIRPVLDNFDKKSQKKFRIILSVFFSLILVFLVIIFSLMLLNNKNIATNSMPFLILFKSQNNVICFIFMVGLLMTLISTALSCLIGVKKKINIDKNDENFVNIIVIITSLIIGQMPFVFFIKIIYPLIAIFNFLLFLNEIFKRLKIRKMKIFKI